MTAQEVIDLAQAGELRNLSPAIRDNETILVGAINMGLIEIYKRFHLKTEEAMVSLVDGRTIYRLDGTDPQVSLTNGTVMYIIAAYGDDTTSDYNSSYLLPLNVEDDLYSVNSISYDEVEIPLITPGAQVSILYVPYPVKATTLALDTELELPEQFLEPLLHYMGYRGHGAMDSNIQTESNTHYMRFEASCNKIKELGVGVTPDDVNMDSRISDRGFV